MVVMSGTALAQASHAVTTSAFLTVRDVMELSSAMMLQMSMGVLAVNMISLGVHGLASVFKARKLVIKSLTVGMDQMKRTVHTENTFAGQTNLNALMAGVFQQANGVIELQTVLMERMSRTVSFSVDLMSLHVRMEDV